MLNYKFKKDFNMKSFFIKGDFNNCGSFITYISNRFIKQIPAAAPRYFT